MIRSYFLNSVLFSFQFRNYLKSKFQAYFRLETWSETFISLSLDFSQLCYFPTQFFYLKSEFERRSLQSNRDKYAFIRNKIENVIDDKRVEPSEKEDDLTILQLFSMHYNVDHN